jgi:hypothetical protein
MGPLTSIAERGPSVLSIGNRIFEVVRGSDINRDGMYLEMSERGGKAGIAEVFYSDETRGFVLNTFGNDIPLDAIEWIATNARLTLPA